jgi:DNA-directed RNA polymerase subunit omega
VLAGVSFSGRSPRIRAFEEASLARITIEDCTARVPNRFHLVQMAAIRAKQLKKGARSLVQNDENKEVVTALREIAAGLIRPDYGAEEGASEK